MKTFRSDLSRVARSVLSPLMNQRGEAGAGDGNEDPKIVVKVGDVEKAFTAADVTNLLAQQAEATQKAQTAAEVVNAASRYGVSVEQFLANAEGTFGIMSTLIDSGLIDEKGEIIMKAPGNPNLNLDPNPALPPGTGPGSAPVNKQLEVALRALMEPLNGKLASIEESNLKLRTDNLNLMRLRLSDKVEGKFPNLSPDDVARVFHMAERDSTKGLMDHAEILSKSKVDGEAELEAKFAKKYGVNIEKAKAAAVFEQDPAGGAAAIVENKKVSFKKGEKTVSPVQASKEFFSNFEGFKP